MIFSSAIKHIKRSLYFFVAAYFGIWAKIVLLRWRPIIVTVIGSSGKTTLLHLLEAQIGGGAIYSHRANSAFGIPFHILGLQRRTFSPWEWPALIFLAPFKIFRTLPVQKLYITEADAERPGEGKFLAELLRPHLLIWLSLGETHGVNFDQVLRNENTKIEQVIAREFAHFLSHTQSLAILHKDNSFIAEQTVPAHARKMKDGIVWLNNTDLQYISVEKDRVIFRTLRDEFTVPKLVPKDVGLSVLAVVQAVKFLGQFESILGPLPLDKNFTSFVLPPGRSSIFVGRKNTTLIDSTYNATIDGMRSMLELFAAYPVAERNENEISGVGEKWLVLGDMIEQGKSEESEHVLLASFIQKLNPDQVIFVGPRLAQYTMPLIPNAISFMKPGEALEYLEKNLRGGETILFKGARFLEGVVEHMLENPADEVNLCRRESVWVARRKQWGI